MYNLIQFVDHFTRVKREFLVLLDFQVEKVNLEQQQQRLLLVKRDCLEHLVPLGLKVDKDHQELLDSKEILENEVLLGKKEKQ